MENPSVDHNEWKEYEPEVRRTQQHARMRGIRQRRRLAERVADEVTNLEELFREQAVPEPDRIPAEVLTDDNTREASVAADEAPLEQPLHEPEQLAQDQPTSVAEHREVTAVSSDTGPAMQPRREIHPVIRLGNDK